MKLTCEEWTASIHFRKDQLPDLNESMIGFKSNVDSTLCNFILTPSVDEIILSFPMDKCGGDFGSVSSVYFFIGLSTFFA